MGIFRQVGRAAKYSAITLPLQIIGLGHFKRSAHYLGSMWRSVRNPACPECGSGVLLRDDGKVDPEGSPDVIDQQQNGKNEMLFLWGCTKCAFKMLGESSARKMASRVIRFRNERIKEKASSMPDPETKQLISRHRFASRFYFLFGSCVFIGFIHKWAAGASPAIALSWVGIAVVLWLFGMKKSYHAWLVENPSNMFTGAFKFWLLNERWFI